MFAKIIGTGSYLPKKSVSNKDLEKILDTSDEWITTRTGIKNRHIISLEETTTYMAYKSAINALEMADIKGSDLDLIIVATTSADNIFPSCAVSLQHKLQANCPAFDIQAVCSGFIFAMDIASKYISSSKNILIVGAESMSKLLDWNDRATAVLFGDGAGAVVISQNKNPGIIYSKCSSDGRYKSSLLTNNNGINKQGFISMNGNEVFKIAVSVLEKISKEALQKTNLISDNINWFIPHQANIRIIKLVAKKINLPMSKVVITLDKHGNTSAASIPLAIDIAVRDGRIKNNDTCLLAAIGAGFCWGSIILKF